MEVSTIIYLVVAIVLAIYLVSVFNRLVSLKNRYQNAFAQIEVQLKRRHDLIPNLVESAKTYLKHESETLEAVISARNTAASILKAAKANPSANMLSSLGQAEGALTSALGQLNVAFEAYPDLKADGVIADLTEELRSTENRVAFARQAFNDDVTDYNTYKQSFPNNFVANFFGHAINAELLEFADKAAIQEAPKVKF